MSGLILPYLGTQPQIDPDAFVAPNATVIGAVEIGPRANVWYNVVLRGDLNRIRVGAGANIQDGTVVHVEPERETVIGANAMIGHMALIHSSILEDDAFIGMMACIMDDCVVESEAMVAAGALLTPGKRVPRGQLWAGTPAKHVRDLSEKEIELFHNIPVHYQELARNHRMSVIETFGTSGPVS